MIKTDGVELTPENLPLLRKTLRDCIDVDPKFGSIYAPTVFACRSRGERPQGAAYPKNASAEIWKLLDECGPERPIDFCNPKPRPAG